MPPTAPSSAPAATGATTSPAKFSTTTTTTPAKFGTPAAAPVTTNPATPGTTTSPAKFGTTPAPSTANPATPGTTTSPATPGTTTAAPVATGTATTAPGTAAAPATAAPSAAAAAARVPADGITTGALELRATRQGGGLVTVRDDRDAVVASLQLRPGSAVRLDLPPGNYKVDDAARGSRVIVSVDPDVRANYVLTPEGARGVAGERPPPPRAGPSSAPGDRPRWKQVMSPIFSSMIPGLGQMVNREPAKGAGFLLGAVALGVGSALLMQANRGTDLSTPGLRGSSFGSEAVSAAGYGVLSGGLQMLYAAQIMDAYAVAAGKRTPTPHVRHRISLEMGRSATVGLRAGDPAAAFYADWSMSVMGQVYRRVSVGIGDLSIKHVPGGARTSLQGGVRIHYRFVERSRVWIGAAAGVILQGSFGRPGGVQVDPDAAAPGNQSAFAAIPYGQVDLRYFILDRWSLNLVPRISAPLGGPRFFNFGGDRAIAKNAATLELGTGIGVYF